MEIQDRNWRRIIGYEVLDNMLTGFFLGLLSIVLLYFFQYQYYHISGIGEFEFAFKTAFLKRSLLGALAIFLLFNYLDKTFAMKGVLISVILVGVYLVYKMFFSI